MNSILLIIVCLLIFITETTLFGRGGGFHKSEDPYFYWAMFVLFILGALYTIYKTVSLWPDKKDSVSNDT